jgi:hypothetical protein
MKLSLEGDPATALLEALQDPRVQEALRQILPTGSTFIEPRYMTAEQYAARLHVAPRTVRSWWARGLPIVRIGDVVRVRVSEADAWLEQGGHVRGAVVQSLQQARLRKAGLTATRS